MFLLGKSGGHISSFVHIHPSKKEGTTKVWELTTDGYKPIAEGEDIRIERFQGVSFDTMKDMSPDEKRRAKAALPTVQITKGGESVFEVRQTLFFTEDFSFVNNSSEKLFITGKGDSKDVVVMFINYTKIGIIVWKMTKEGFQIIAEGKDVQISRLQALSSEEKGQMSEDEKRKAKSLPPRVRISTPNQPVVIELSEAKFFKETSPMRISFK